MVVALRYNLRMYKQVRVEPSLAAEALEHAILRLEYEYDRFHLAKEQRISMIALGTLGQLVFKSYLEVNNIPFQFQLQYGKYDDYDFIINDNIVEVKSSGYQYPNEWTRLNAIYNASQLERARARQYYCSVQLFLNGYDRSSKLLDISQCDTGIIAGWIEIRKIAETKPRYLPHGEAHLVPLSQLKDIDALF